MGEGVRVKLKINHISHSIELGFLILIINNPNTISKVRQRTPRTRMGEWKYNSTVLDVSDIKGGT
jgi:hypothetical protein